MAADPERLFAQHHQQLFRYLCRAVGQTEVARDLTQDVFLRVSRGSVPDATTTQLKAWLFRIARNLAIDHHRRRTLRPEAQEMRESGRSASQHTTVIVNEALASLADLDRDVFLMREVGGLRYDEIAAACDLTHAAVRDRLHRARTHLREWLAAPIQNRRAAPLRQHPSKQRHDS
jgi:RNA polymerase sigma-70 factor (ECF subfamily)